MKKYIAKPEFLEKKGNEDLYIAEQEITNAIYKVIDLRMKKFGEKEWEALPQTLRRILENWEKDASIVAAYSYLSLKEESCEVYEEKK